MVLIAADAYFLSAASEKAAALLDNRAIYTQTDREGTQWSFNSTAWTREDKADTTNDGIDNPTSTPITASYQKARELNYQATNAAAALALRDAPAPQDPYRLPANDTDRPSLRTADWERNPNDGQWRRMIKIEVYGENDRGSYVQETALPHRKAELDAQAQDVIARNIANSPGAIAARYELAHHRSGWAADGLPMSPAVQQALPDPDALIASNGQRYYRNIDGQWTTNGSPPDGNRVLELETTRAMLLPALAEHAQAIAAIQQSPPSAQDLLREETQYRYRIVGTELQPQWREAIELATQRTRDTEGLAGDGALQLQRGPGGQFGADSPIAHLQRGPDGVERIAAVTSTEDIHQALQEVQARQAPLSLPDQPPALHLTATARASDESASGDASSGNTSSSPRLVMDMQARAAQAQQEREQQDRLAQEQHATQVREHLQQARPEHDDRSQSEQAVQAHTVLEGQRQVEQQREHLEQEERQQQERQAQTSQQRELQEREERDVQQRQAQENQQREQQDRQTQEARYVEVQEGQAQRAQHQQQQTQELEQQDQRQRASQQASQQPDTQTRAPDAALSHQTTRAELQQEHGRQQSESQSQQTREHLAPDAHEPLKQMPGPGDTQPGQAQEMGRALEMQAMENRDAARLQAAAPKGPESRTQPPQGAESGAMPPALHNKVQMHQAEIEQASLRQQDVAHQQEVGPVHAIDQTTPATVEPLIASRSTVSTSPEREAEAQQTRPADALPGQHGAAVLPPEHLAQAHEHSLARGAGTRVPVGSADAENQQAPLPPAEDRSAAEPSSALLLEETMRSLRQLQQEIEAADREDERFYKEWREYRERGEPYPFAQKRALDQEGGSIDAFSAHEQGHRSPSQAAAQADAFPPLAQRLADPKDGNAPNESSQIERKSITGDPDVDEVLYALQSKNELAIEQAL
ncbi:hypothetical protein, partial [Xanthomonas campestris]